MKRAALFVCLLASCVAPASGPYATGPVYSSAPPPRATYQQQATYTGYEFDRQPQGYPDGYPAGYQAGYPEGYPNGYPAYPQEECKSAYGVTACGFGCVAAYGEVKCAVQPGGACTAAYGQVTCFEPPAQTVSGGYGVLPANECSVFACTN